jgi:YD repeat-containing protein
MRVHDGLGRLAAVRDDDNAVLARYAYDARSRRASLAYANGAGAKYEYDTASRLLSLDNSAGSAQYLYE